MYKKFIQKSNIFFLKWCLFSWLNNDLEKIWEGGADSTRFYTALEPLID